MKQNEVYCEQCDKIVKDYITKTIKKTITVGDGADAITFETDYIEAYCPICGEQVWPWFVGKQNDKLIYDTYKRLAGLLTSEDIKAIRKKRGLSQVQLARLIHCGEKNIARYENGAVQDNVFDLLIRLVDNDAAYKVIKSMEFNDGKAQHTTKSN